MLEIGNIKEIVGAMARDINIYFDRFHLDCANHLLSDVKHRQHATYDFLAAGMLGDVRMTLFNLMQISHELTDFQNKKA